MDGTWCIASEVQRGKSRYRYDFIHPFNLYLEFMSREFGQDLSWITPHVMRHTFGSLLAIAGESLAKISEWMGDDPRVTDRHYLHFKEGDIAINKLHSFVPVRQQPRQPARRCNPRRKSASSKPSTRRSQTALITAAKPQRQAADNGHLAHIGIAGAHLSSAVGDDDDCDDVKKFGDNPEAFGHCAVEGGGLS
jgi:hypothetical protein